MMTTAGQRRRLAVFVRLYGKGLSFAAIARRLGVTRNAVHLWAKRFGLPAPPGRYGPAWQRRHGAAMRGAWQRRECDSLAGWRRLRGQRLYGRLGYPPGVGNAAEALAVDAARRLHGLTVADFRRAGYAGGNPNRVLRELAGAGVLVPLGLAASNVRTRQLVGVWRLDFRAE